MIKQSQIINVIKFHLTNLRATKKTEITEDTIIQDALPADTAVGGFGAGTPQGIFKTIIQGTLKLNGIKKPKVWPKLWPEFTVKELAERILILLLVLLPVAASSQLVVNVSTVKTENKNNALEVGLSYIRSLDSMFKTQDIIIATKKSMFAVTPEFNIRSGTADAFSSITAKATGMFLFFGTTVVDGLLTPNTSKAFSVVPVSLGIETNNKFSSVNAIAEAGYFPYYQTGAVPDWVKRTKIGFFTQAGYKWSGDSAVIPVGGQIDESEEAPNEFIFRLKGSAAAEINSPVSIGSARVGLVGSGDLWLDIANRATYYRYDATVRFYLEGNRYLDLIYQRGAGAPTFNQGDQFGIGLSITF